jgi:DNA-binding MarR family transcriptional regulator
LAVYYETEFGLSMAEWRVLVHLSRCPLVSEREIHNCVNLEKSRVSRAVRKLEVRKMLRKSESAQDQRLPNIALTAKGRDVLAKIVTFALSFEKTLMAALEQQEADVLESTFETLHHVLDSDPHAGLRSRLDVPAALPANGSV